jgi:molybdenum-dependent DNA-binding transcriptional regulator ModE
MPTAERNQRTRPDLELRVVVNGRMVIGPVRASLLDAIRTTGSISSARHQLGASCAHA